MLKEIHFVHCCISFLQNKTTVLTEFGTSVNVFIIPSQDNVHTTPSHTTHKRTLDRVVGGRSGVLVPELKKKKVPQPFT